VSSGELIVRIEPDGTATAIYDDTLVPVWRALGRVTIRRASHVEPVPGEPLDWQADLTPEGGPILGPFPTRRAALDAERAWLEARLTGIGRMS
jgi:hypothetical protein